MIALLVFAGLLILAYFMLYFGGRKYLETFAGSSSIATPQPTATAALSRVPPEKPYSLQRIDRMDDYEMSAIFQNEGTKEATKRDRDQAMAQYPMDWVTQGTNSQSFQEGQAAYQKTKAASMPMLTQPDDDDQDVKDMLLPDHTSQEEEEKKILQTYRPKCTKSLLSYCVDDVKAMVDRIYGKKGLIPVIEKSKQGTNIWEIVEVKEKNPKIVWEDDPATATAEDSTRDIMTSRGEEVITVPYPASDLAAGMDPFFQTGSSSRDGRHDYTKWTPGLERMYAPTYPVKSWF